MQRPSLADRLLATLETWGALVPFALWAVAPDGHRVFGQPPADSDASYALEHDGWQVGASGFAESQRAAVERGLRHILDTFQAAAAVADQQRLESWSQQALQELYGALAQGSGNVRTLLSAAIRNAADGLDARVMAVALLDETLGTLEVTTAIGAPDMAVRHFVEAYGPTLGLNLAAGEPVHLPGKDGGWGPGWALPLTAPAGPVGLMLVWGDEAAAECRLGRLTWIARHLALIIGAAQLETDWRESLLGVFAAVASAVDAKAPYTAGQSGRATLLALTILDDLGEAGISRGDLRLAGLLHDIGNVGVSDEILAKKAALTTDEQAAIRQHPEIAGRMLASLPRLGGVRRAILHHHERWDGAGYPDRLRHDDIPIGARILAVADALIALLSPRPYRPAMGFDDAIAEIRRGLASQFDPAVCEALFRCCDRNPGLIASLTSVPSPQGQTGGTGILTPQRDPVEGPALRLPVMPQTLVRLHALAKLDPKPTGEVISLLSADPALSARIMRYANSRRLGFSRQITTVSQVILLLGVERVCNLAFGFGLYDSFLSGEQQFAPWEFIGPHGLLTATSGRLLCQILGQEPMEDEAFMAGMLHDIGRAILAQERPEDYAAIVQSHPDGQQLVDEERARFGRDHAAVGAEAARGWGLPARLIQAIAWHHEPWRAAPGTLPTIVAAASEYARAAEHKTPLTPARLIEVAGWLGAEPKLLESGMARLISEANPILISLRPERH